MLRRIASSGGLTRRRQPAASLTCSTALPPFLFRRTRWSAISALRTSRCCCCCKNLLKPAERKKGSRTDIVFRQWLQLAGVSYGIRKADTPWPDERDQVLGALSEPLGELQYAEAIFTIHTYVALWAKLIAAEMLAMSVNAHDKRPSQWLTLRREVFQEQFEKLESGQLAESLRAPRLMGADFFGWYAPLLKGNVGLERRLRSALRSFADLAWARLAHVTAVTGDLLREFYTAVMPRRMRKALGEFFTPQWIAERVVRKAVEVSGASEEQRLRILDPTCGSGTFLVTSLQRALSAAAARGLPRAQQTLEAVDSVIGFDINPVSPLMARVNLLLALGDRVEDLGEVVFHVYQADSILIPEEPSGALTFDEAGASLQVPLIIGDVLLPESLADLDAVGAVARVIDQSLGRNRSRATFMRRLSPELVDAGVTQHDLDEALEAAAVIYERLQVLHSEGKNGLWATVIEQSFAPRVLEPVDLVVGNPPWISWKHLPEAWQQRSEPAWRQWGLWQRKKRNQGVPMSDISTLLLARSVATYCPTGVVALLLPEGIVVNEPGGRAIRRCSLHAEGIPLNRTRKTQAFAPTHVDDFTALNPFSPDASNRPIALYVRAGVEAAFPMTGTEWRRTKARTSLRTDAGWRDIGGLLTATDVSIAPIDPSDRASRWRPTRRMGELPLREVRDAGAYTWGQGFHTRGADGIFYCEVTSARPLPRGLVRILTRPELGRNTSGVVPQEELEVEADFLWPLIRGQNVRPFVLESSGLHCIVPHDPDDLSRILRVDELIDRSPRLFDYLERHIPRLLGRSAYDMKITEDRPWGIQGTAWRHIHANAHLVVARYMHPAKTPPAAISSPTMRTDLGRNTCSYPNNKVNFLACASLEEADYISAYVNSAPAQESIAHQTSSTTIPPIAMNRLPMPLFDSTDARHRALMELGAACRENHLRWLSVGGEVGELVMSLSEAARSRREESANSLSFTSPKVVPL